MNTQKSATQPRDATAPQGGCSKGCCCKDKYEFSWLKQESCCFCCGIRCALLSLCILCLVDGVQTFGLGLYFGLFATHRSPAGAVLDMAFGVAMFVTGCIGYYGAWKTHEPAIRVFWYCSVSMIPLITGVCTWAIIEFAMRGNTAWVTALSVDLVFAILIWSYIAYKVKKFHDLVFSHYQELDDGIKQGSNKQAVL